MQVQPPTIAATHSNINASHDDGISLLLNFYLFMTLKKKIDDDI